MLQFDTKSVYIKPISMDIIKFLLILYFIFKHFIVLKHILEHVMILWHFSDLKLLYVWSIYMIWKQTRVTG